MLPSDAISLVIVDDHSIVIEGLKTLLNGEEAKINIIGSFTTGQALESFLRRRSVDVILLDISLPDASGIDLCKQVKKQYPTIKVLALSNHAERSIIMQMMQNGASGYLLKNVTSEELINSIQTVVSGGIAFSNEVNKIMVNPSNDAFKELPRLTKREQEILKLISKGHTTQAIADALFVSPLTIETHRRNLMVKFKVKNAAELIMEAAKQKLV